MKQVITAFAAITCIFIACMGPAPAQPIPQIPVQGPGNQGVTVGFMNNSHTPVIVKGYTLVKGVPIPGQLLPMKKDGKAFEKVPPNTPRFYTVYDATNPTRVLLLNQPVPIQNRDLVLMIKTSPLDPTRVVIIAVPTP
jgi:hypothetical protein